MIYPRPPLAMKPWQAPCSRAARLALLAPLLTALIGCQVLYDTKLADSQRDCEKLVMQSDVNECKRKLRAQQDAWRRSQDDKAKADKAPAAPRR